MDSNHTLDAPDDTELSQIEQVSDRSELSSMYPQAHDQWDGDIVSPLERDRRHHDKQDTITFGIRKHFALIGLLIPMPFAIAAVFGTAAQMVINEDNIQTWVIPSIVAFLIWVSVSFLAYKRIFSVFYQNALSAAPFIFTLFTMLVFSAPTLYFLTIPIHDEAPLTAVLYVALLEFVLSIILTALLLVVWTTPRLRAGVKFGLIALLAVILLGIMTYILFL